MYHVEILFFLRLAHRLSLISYYSYTAIKTFLLVALHSSSNQSGDVTFKHLRSHHDGACL